MKERMNLNMEDLEMVTGGSSGTDRYKCGEQKKSDDSERVIRH